MSIENALSLAVKIVDPDEGFSATAYLDHLARPPIWTIGHGTTRVGGKPVVSGMTCTPGQADLWAMADMTAAAHFVMLQTRVPLEDCQIGALVSFCYNIGDGNFARSSVLSLLNQGDYTGAADALLRYDEAGGVPLKGLKLRRAAERALFLSGATAYVHSALPPAPTGADDLNAAELKSLGSNS